MAFAAERKKRVPAEKRRRADRELRFAAHPVRPIAGC